MNENINNCSECINKYHLEGPHCLCYYCANRKVNCCLDHVELHCPTDKEMKRRNFYQECYDFVSVFDDRVKGENQNG